MGSDISLDWEQPLLQIPTQLILLKLKQYGMQVLLLRSPLYPPSKLSATIDNIAVIEPESAGDPVASDFVNGAIFVVQYA